MRGHVHIVAGDITALSCDAWLLPTDSDFGISPSFAGAIDLDDFVALTRSQWHGARVLPLRRESDQSPRIWLGDIGRVSQPASWYAAAIEPFVEAATKEISRAGVARLAVNVLGTGDGGMSAEKGEIYRALLPEMWAAVSEREVDLLLVCWGRRSYSAAQRTRQLLLQEQEVAIPDHWQLGPRASELHATAGRLAAAARVRDLVAFVGAGVSMGAGLPAWQGLLDGIAETLDAAPDLSALRRLDVRDQAALLQRRLRAEGRDLAGAISDLIAHDRCSLQHAQLASLPIREFVTTNYDRLMERAIEASHDRVGVLPFEVVETGQRWVLKLHGSLDRTESIVLTRGDYLNAPATQGALFGLLQAMLLTRHMLFVGYSLTDEDFHQVVHEVRQANADRGGTLGTVLTLFHDPLFEELWGDDLDVVPMRDVPDDLGSPADVAEAARTLEILLDLVGYLAADLDAFLLDRTYSDLLHPAERELATRLLELGDTLAECPDLPVATRLRQLLVELGLHQPRGDTSE